MSRGSNYCVSSLLAGVIAAFLSAIPYISSLNCLCCLWLVGGGVWSAYLFYWSEGAITFGQGVVTGVLSGLWASPVYAVLSTIIWSAAKDRFAAQVQVVLEHSQQMPHEFSEVFADILMSPLSVFLITLASALLVFPVVMGVGGVIGAAIWGCRVRRGDTVGSGEKRE